MFATVTLTLDPPLPRPGGTLRHVKCPADPCVLGPLPDGPRGALVARYRAEFREEIARHCALEYGPGVLSGDPETGFTFRPDPL